MRRKIRFIILILVANSFTIFTQSASEKIVISDNIEIQKLSDNIYLHTSYFQTENWGKVGANGLIVVENGKALMIDTPWNDDQTKELTHWVEDSLQATMAIVIPTHWHEDCMGGLAYLQSKGVDSYTNQMTIDITKEKGLPVPQNGFKDSLTIKFQNIDINCYYLGGGHSTDNIVVWIPSEGVLFGGCAIKDINAQSLGNLADADVKAWPTTMRKMIEKFSDARIIIPGHGAIGGCELMQHTLNLLDK